MNFCSQRSFVCVGLLAVAGIAEGANLTKESTASPRIRSIVRADSRGRLVRTVVVNPRMLPARIADTDASGESASARIPAADVPALVEAAARKYDLDPLLVHAVIQVESAYNAYAISPKGAQGLMQLMPGTARRFGVTNSFDPRENIEGGVRYLKYLTTLFPNDPQLALAAYNAGEGAVWKYNYQIPPYRETEQYVRKVSQRYGQAKRQARSTPPPVQTASLARADDKPAGPVYAPVETFVDSDGRLHMRTIGASEVRTP